MFTDPIFYTVLSAVIVAGVSAGTVKATLNGTVERMRKIHSELQTHIKEEAQNDMQTHERIARVETKVDILLENTRVQ